MRHYTRHIMALAASLLVMLALCAEAAASSIPKKVLVICSHSETSDYAVSMLAPITRLEHTRPDIQLYTAYLRLTSLSGTEELEQRVQTIVEGFESSPDLVILAGGSSYPLAQCLSRVWDQVPMILAGETDYVTSAEFAIFGTDSLENRIPLVQMRQGRNMTYVQAPVYPENAVELIRSLRPGLRKIYLISGENFYSRNNEKLIVDYLTRVYPEYEYEILRSTENSTEQLLNRVLYAESDNSGIIFLSWITHNDYMKNLFLSNNVMRMLDEYSPVVSMTICDLGMMRSTLGYWSYNASEYSDVLTSVVLDVLDGKSQPRDIDPVVISQGNPVVNVGALEKFGIAKKLIPYGTVLVNRSMSKWFFIQWLAITVGIFIILFGSVIVAITSNRLARHRKKSNIELEKLTAQLQAANEEALKAKDTALRMKEQAEKASEMKSRFLQNMSHDVRTPLNAIVGFTQLLALPDDFLEEGDKEKFTSYITNNANVLMMLVDDILNMSDVESGSYKIVMQSANVNDICRMCLKSVEYRIQPGVTDRFTTDASDDLQIKTDPRRVQQILTNFLTNACKHTLSGEIVIACDTTTDPDRVLFSVSDTGPGVPPEKREKIFERFTKLDAYVEGAGIGLNICTTLASKLGAEVRLDETYTAGARFILAVPKTV